MKTLFYDVVSSPTTEKILQDIDDIKPERIVIFSELEWYCGFLNKNLAEKVNKENIKVVVTLCSFPHEFYLDQVSLFNNIEIEYWPTYWANWSLMCGLSNKLCFDRTYTNFEHPFICLNNRNHIHRCMLIDELSKNDLISKGIVTWHKFLATEHSPCLEHFDDRIITLDDDFKTLLDSFLIPPVYHKSFLHVVGEATTSVTCISEKTWLPILYRKPFVVMANQYFHSDLVSLGFELYDEIIDYSFDSEPDMRTRASMIADNVKRIVSDNTENLYKIIKPKADRNYQCYMELVSNPDYIPSIIKERITMLSTTNCDTVYTDPRYLEIAKMTGLL